MQRITLDPRLRTRLANVEGGAALCDEKGKTLGYFFPAGTARSDDLERQLLYAWAETLVNDEELNQARQSPGGRTTEEVLERLERLGS